MAKGRVPHTTESIAFIPEFPVADPVEVNAHVIDTFSSQDLGELSFSIDAQVAALPGSARIAASMAVVKAMGGNLSSVSVADKLVAKMNKDGQGSLDKVGLTAARTNEALSTNADGSLKADDEQLPLLQISGGGEEALGMGSMVDSPEDKKSVLSESTGETEVISSQLEEDEPHDMRSEGATNDKALAEESRYVVAEAGSGEPQWQVNTLGSVMLFDTTEIADMPDREEDGEEAESVDGASGIREALSSLLFREVTIEDLEDHATEISERLLGILGVFHTIELDDNVFTEDTHSEAEQAGFDFNLEIMVLNGLVEISNQ
jgi:hypothetical protein